MPKGLVCVPPLSAGHKGWGILLEGGGMGGVRLRIRPSLEGTLKFQLSTRPIIYAGDRKMNKVDPPYRGLSLGGVCGMADFFMEPSHIHRVKK